MAKKIKAVEDLLQPRDEAFNEHKIDMSWWVGKLKDKANAKVVRVVTQGKKLVAKKYDDNRIQLDALKEIGKAGDFYPAEKHDHNLKTDESTMALVVEAIQKAKNSGEDGK